MTIRSIFHRYLTRGLSRRQFVTALGQMGVGAVAAGQMAQNLAATPPQSERHRFEKLSGGQLTCETLKLWDVQYVFGNTGGYEAGFLDALVDYPDIRYVLGLHEGPIMAMADGYARITGKTAFVNIHAITGTANALGFIVNAWADNSPVVVTVGLSDTRADNSGTFTETAKLEAVPEAYSKLSFRAARTDVLVESLRRAFQLASSLPTGPVFLGVPADVWAGEIAQAELFSPRRSRIENRVTPESEAIRKAADWLAEAANPLLVAGAELPRWGGLKELQEISDLLGAAVVGDTTASRSSMGFPTSHPRYLGPLRGPIESLLAFDLVVVAGASRFTMMRGGRALFDPATRVIEFGIREDHLAREYAADLLLYAHPEATLQRLGVALRGRTLDPERVRARAANAADLRRRGAEEREKRLRQVWDSTPIAPERLAAEIDRSIAGDAIVVTETVSSDAHVWDHIGFDQPGGGRRHVVSSGGSLGWGLGAACGVKLGAPKQQVVALLGDGSYQFAVQALWTAKRFEIPILVVLFNNRSYQANRWAQAGLRRSAARTGQFIGTNLVDPDIDHVGIARSYGIDGERVADPGQLADALQRALAVERSGKPYILDVVVDRRGGGADSDWYEKFSVAALANE